MSYFVDTHVPVKEINDAKMANLFALFKMGHFGVGEHHLTPWIDRRPSGSLQRRNGPFQKSNINGPF